MADIIELKKRQIEVINKLRKRSKTITLSRFSIILLLDTSGSMFGEKITDAKDALIHFLKSVNLTENEVGLVSFGGSITTQDFSRDHNFLEKKIKILEADGGTPLMGGINAAYSLLCNRIKPVMVIASDGQPTDAKDIEILKVCDSIKEEGVRIITIGIGEDANRYLLRNIASSPEDYHFAKASFELKKIYEEVADILALPEKKMDCLKGK